MKEFDFESVVKKTIKQLKEDLQKYKAKLSPEFKTTDKIKPVELYQIRKLLTSPAEYVVTFYIEDTGLAHTVPLTEYVSLVPSNLRIYISDQYTLAPLPFYAYLNKLALEKISIPIARVGYETIEKILEDVEQRPTISHIRPIKEFVEIVWKRYEQLVIASLLYNVIEREKALGD